MNRSCLKSALILSSLFFCAFAPARGAASDGDRVQIRGPVVVGAGESVERAVAVMGSVQIDGTVHENAVSVFGDVTIGPKGAVQGDAISVGGRVFREPGSKVGGKQIALGLPMKGMEKIFFVGAPFLAGAFALLAGVVLLAYTIGLVALVVLILTIFEGPVAGVREKLVAHPAKSFILGILGFISVLPILLLLTVTIVGIPLAFAAAVVAMAAVIVGMVGVGQWLGTEVAKKFQWKLKPVWTGLLGLTLLALISLVPVIGHLIHITAHCFGLGAVMQSRFKGPSA